MSEPPAPELDTTPRRTLRRQLLVLLGLFVGVSLVVVASSWYAVFYWAKSTGRLERWVARRPDRFQLRWTEIDSSWPFVVDARGVVVAARTHRVRWELAADRARVTIDPLALLDRQLVLRNAAVSGAALHVSKEESLESSDAGEPSAPRRHLPPIAAFPAVLAAPAVPSAKPWSWIVSDLAVDALREVWIDELRVTGSGSGELSLALRRREWAEVEPSRLRIEGASVTLGEHLLGERLAGEIALRIVPWRYRGAKVTEVSRHFQGKVELTGESPIAPALAYLFGERPWLELSADLATFETSIVFDRGRLRSGSRLEATLAPTIAALGFVAAGPAKLTAEVEGEHDSERLESTLLLGAWTLARPGEAALFNGEGLRVDAWSTAPRTDRPPSAHRLVVDLGHGRADDLRFVNAMVPKAAGVSVERGTLSLTGELRFETSDRSGSGELALHGERLALLLRGQRFAADAAVDLKLAEPDLVAGSFSLAGSKLSLTKVAAATSAGGRVDDWWGEVELRSGRVTLRRPFSSEGELVSRSADTRPVIAFYELKRDLPPWAERALLLEDVRISGRYRLSPGRLELDDVRLPLPNGEARAEVDLAREHRRARLLLSWRRLDLGIEIDGADRKLHFIGARPWFERRVSP